jgi:UDP-N-acetylmuramoyl-tripeptide--D-alanyl-D-alanine ligase
VLEMGMSHVGEIAYLTKIAKPKVAVITNASAVHLEGVQGGLKTVAQAKGEIFQGLQPGGKAILNADDKSIDYWQQLVSDYEVMTFGLENPADVSASDIKLSPAGSEFMLHTSFGMVDINLPLLGRHNVMNALAATAACLALGIDLAIIKQGLESVQAVNRRLQIKTTKSGACLLDDCYNASPSSLRAAIDVLAMYPGKKILVLGDMKELGPDEKAMHFACGEYAKAAGIDLMLCLGELAQEAAAGFGTAAQHFNLKQDLLNALKPMLGKNVNVLVKGSRSMKMEDIAEAL